MTKDDLTDLLGRHGIDWDVFWRGSDCLRYPPNAVTHEMQALRVILEAVAGLLDESHRHEDDGGNQGDALAALDDARAILGEALAACRP